MTKSDGAILALQVGIIAWSVYSIWDEIRKEKKSATRAIDMPVVRTSCEIVYTADQVAITAAPTVSVVAGDCPCSSTGPEL